jgi:hypothetical protein
MQAVTVTATNAVLMQMNVQGYFKAWDADVL